MKIKFTIIALSMLFCVCGCNKGSTLSGLVPASGELLVNGKPVEGATISFHLVEQTRAASAITDRNGKFTVMTLNPSDGIYSGEYLITVTKIEERGELKESGEENKGKDEWIIQDTREIIEYIPQKYVDSNTSDLKITIPAKGDKNILLHLTGEVDLTPKKVSELKRR
jgi:hypothetical protein